MNNFKLYSQYYDLIYNDKNYENEVIYLNKQIKQFKKNSKKILELGCGSGSHAYYLTKNGYKVTGVELSKAMFEIALNKKIKNFDLVNSNIIDFRSSINFDVVISMFHVISYINNNNDILKCFRNTANNLKKGGLFLFDVWYLPAVLTIKPISKVKKISNDFLSVIRVTDSVINYNNNNVNVNFQIFINDKNSKKHFSFEETHIMRYFSLPEIELFASLSGFKIIASKEMGTEIEPNEKTWGVLFILQKI